jgi:DNA-binding PadR family transcriptional regulator
MSKGASFGDHGWAAQRRGSGRARRGDVRLALLRLLAEEPCNGYKLIQAVEERSEGLWRPSPGSVYPTLARLEDEGLIRSTGTKRARRFEIADAGREFLDSRADEPAPWETASGATPNPLTALAPLVIRIGEAAFHVASVGDRAQGEQAQALLAGTHRALSRILTEGAHKNDADEHEREV